MNTQAREMDETRNFALRDQTGTETSVFPGRTPRQAALKAARRLEPAASEQEADHKRITLREKGTTKRHMYDGWAWETDAPADKPDWMPERITEANVAKHGIEHLDDFESSPCYPRVFSPIYHFRHVSATARE